MARKASKSATPPLTWEPALPHPAHEVEAFCQDLAAGRAATDSFVRHFDSALDGIDTDASSVRARAHRLSRRPDVEQRTIQIRKQRGRPVEAISEVDLHRLMVEVTNTLAAAHGAAHDAGAAPQQLSALRKEITRHVGRAGRMRPRIDAPHDAAVATAGLLEVLANLPLCECVDRLPEERSDETPEAVAQRGQTVMNELGEYIADLAMQVSHAPGLQQ